MFYCDIVDVLILTYFIIVNMTIVDYRKNFIIKHINISSPEFLISDNVHLHISASPGIYYFDTKQDYLRKN